MIYGIGNDLVDIRRIEKSIERFGERFLDKTFTPGEQKTAEGKKASAKAKASSLAKRYAAKEAFAKALGTGFVKGLRLVDVEVVNDKLGKPSIKLHGKAAKLLPAATAVHLSMADEYPYAQAFVIISAAR